VPKDKAMPTFWGFELEQLVHAYRRTRSFVREHLVPQSIAGALLTAILGTIQWLHEMEHDWLEKTLWTLGLSALGGAIWILLVFLWCWIPAPFALYKKRTEEAKAATDELNKLTPEERSMTIQAARLRQREARARERKQYLKKCRRDLLYRWRKVEWAKTSDGAGLGEYRIAMNYSSAHAEYENGLREIVNRSPAEFFEPIAILVEPSDFILGNAMHPEPSNISDEQTRRAHRRICFMKKGADEMLTRLMHAEIGQLSGIQRQLRNLDQI
jgi:hypothetical protein